MSNNSIKRRHVFINQAFQGRFIVGAFLLILLSGLCSAGLIYWLIGGDLQAQSQTAHANIMTAWQRLGLSIFIGNLVAIVIAGAAATIAVIYASHKIAGPLYRFEKLCEQIGAGQLDTMTSLREHDQLQQLGAAFTAMVEKLRARKGQQQNQIDLLTTHVESLKNDANLGDAQRESLSKLESLIKELKV